jgi:GTP cyclohydrolase II
VLIYTPDEGRGVGLLEKVRAMELERKTGITTAEAFGRLGHKPDPRNYDAGIDAMRKLNVPREVRLISNNPAKISAVEAAGFKVVERVEPRLILTRRTAEVALATQRSLGHIEFTNLQIEE